METWIKRVKDIWDDESEEQLVFQHKGAMKVYFSKERPNYITMSLGTYSFTSDRPLPLN